MFCGVKFPCHPTPVQANTLMRWMGCDRVIWNAKVDESNYYRKFALKFHPREHYYATQDQSYSQFKSSELTPYLSQVPSQVLRNAAVRWYQTLQKAIKGLCGFPKRKRKGNHASVYLTRELFRFEKAGKGYRLFIGTPKFPVGELRFSPHREFKVPNSITVTHHNGRFYLSFGYENHAKSLTLQQQFDRLRGMDADTLTQGLVGVDMGITIPACSELANFDYSPSQKAHFKRADNKAKYLQRRLSKQRRMAKTKGQPPSKRSNRTQQRLNAQHGRKANIRQDFAHKTSRQLVDSVTLGLVMEKLNIKGLTKRPKAVRDVNGHYLPNKAKAKAALNHAMLSVGMYQIRLFSQYKALSQNKAVFTIHPAYTSQECAVCGHIHPTNRTTQSQFACTSCGNVDNADHNAAIVIKNRGVTRLLDSGTELSGNHLSDTGHGGKVRRVKGKSLARTTDEVSKKTGRHTVLEATSFRTG